MLLFTGQAPHMPLSVVHLILIVRAAGVGLSYSDRGSSDYFTNDDTTAADAEIMLRKCVGVPIPWPVISCIAWIHAAMSHLAPF